jgi:hypothetical protein
VQFSATSQPPPLFARHTVVEGTNAFAGHAALVPPQTSCVSQMPAETRHTVPAATPVSAGHAAAEPVQLSATSQPPPLFARHTVVEGTNTFVGHAALVPPQTSCVSQMPAEARHTVPAAAPLSAGHVTPVPVHVSATSQPPPLFARHTVAADRKPSAGHATLEPSQASTASHTPADARHTVPAAVRPSLGHAAAEPVHISCGSHTPADARHCVVEGRNTFVGHAAPVPAQVSAVSHTPADARHTVPAATLPQLVAPDAAVGTTHTWQLFAGLSAPFEKHTPPMRQKPSSISPLQSLSSPSHTSAVGVHTGRVAVIVKFAHVVGADTRYRRTHTVSGHAVVRVRKPVPIVETLSTNTHCESVIPHDAVAAQLVRTSIRIDGSLDVRLTRGEPPPRSSVPDG